MEDLDGSYKEIQPVLLDNMDFLSDADRFPNSIIEDNITFSLVLLVFVYAVIDLLLIIKKRKSEGQKYGHLILVLMFYSLIFILFINFALYK